MAKIFKPRRALNSTIKTGSKKNTILASGELMVVSRGNAIGANNKHDIYMGDGVTTMENLKPALYGDTSTEDITITADSSTSSTLALANVVTGRTLGALIGSLKKAISLIKTELSGDITSITTSLGNDYYTQTQINTLLSSYAPSSHTHSEYAKLNSSATFSDLYIINDNSSTSTSIGIQCSRNNKAKFTLTADAEGGGISLYSPNGTNFMHIDHNTDSSARLYFNNGSTLTGSFGFDINKTVSYANMKNFVLSVNQDGENVLTITDI